MDFPKCIIWKTELLCFGKQDLLISKGWFEMEVRG